MTRYASAFLTSVALAVGLFLTTALEGFEGFLNTNHFTFSRAVAVPGAELAPGTYIFERLAVTEPSIVVVRSQDRSKVYFMGRTERVERPRHLRLDAPSLALGEARPGVAAPITTWYPTGSSRGHRFVYR